MTDKQENELKIFKLFYGKDCPREYEHQDKPDFWVTAKCGLKYGVEVTELFDNDSEARLAKIPGYIDELFDNQNVRHKDDKVNLKIQQITITSPDNVHVATVPALMYNDSDVNSYVSRLVNRIKERVVNQPTIIRAFLTILYLFVTILMR